MNSVESVTRHIYSYSDWGKKTFHRTLVAVMCGLSISGSFTIAASYVSWQDIQTTSRKILLFLSISDFLIAATNLVGLFLPMDNENYPQNSRCVMQSFITNAASITSFLWTATLAIYLYLAIVKNKQGLGKKLLPLFHVFNWSLGPIINGIALYENALGYSSDSLSGGWCWIYHNSSLDTNKTFMISKKEILWIMLDAKGIEIIIYPAIILIYAIIKCKLHREIKQSNQVRTEILKSAKRADRKLIFVPLLLFFGRFWGILRTLLVIFQKDTEQRSIGTKDKILFTLQGIGDSSQGFLNCILFCLLNSKVFNHIKCAILRYICCKRTTVESLRFQAEPVASVTTYAIPSSSLLEPSGDDKQPLLRPVAGARNYRTIEACKWD